jgi:S1-C subfamily serine protease
LSRPSRFSDAIDAGSPPRSAPPSFTPATGSPIAPADISLLEQINRENIRVIASALPSIVRISATMAVDPRAEMSGNFTRLPFPFERHDATPVSEVAYGSGVVLKKDGYIVTNRRTRSRSRFSCRIIVFFRPPSCRPTRASTLRC